MAMNPLQILLNHCTIAPASMVGHQGRRKVGKFSAATHLSVEPEIWLHQNLFLTVPDSSKHLLQLTLLIHFFNYVCTAYKLPLDVQLQNTKSGSCFSHTNKLHLHSHVQCHARIRCHKAGARTQC